MGYESHSDKLFPLNVSVNCIR